MLTIAEESTSWPGVSRPVYLGGLGFGFKWNMGWMHDTLTYFSKEPVHRRHHHQQLTFGLLYAFSENFVLPISHDEVVHGKGSLINKMPGDKGAKVANLRALLAWMWAHPGKQLLFMGCEIGQEREWSHDRSLDWDLLGDPGHRGVQELVGELNRIYRDEPALWEVDFDGDGLRVDRRQRRRPERALVRAGTPPAGHGRWRASPTCRAPTGRATASACPSRGRGRWCSTPPWSTAATGRPSPRRGTASTSRSPSTCRR